jgi:hypothetical protein
LRAKFEGRSGGLEAMEEDILHELSEVTARLQRLEARLAGRR